MFIKTPSGVEEIQDTPGENSTAVPLEIPASPQGVPTPVYEDALPDASIEELQKLTDELIEELVARMMKCPSLSICTIVQGGTSRGLKDIEKVRAEVRAQLNVGAYLDAKHNLVCKPMLIDADTWPKDPDTRVSAIKLVVQSIS